MPRKQIKTGWTAPCAALVGLFVLAAGVEGIGRYTGLANARAALSAMPWAKRSSSVSGSASRELAAELNRTCFCISLDRQGLADAMEKMCASRARREEMGRIGQRRVDAYFHHEQMLASYRKMYDETAKEYHLE